MTSPILKACSDCKAWKATTEYHKDRKAPDGLSYICRPCASVRTRVWYAKNKERARAANEKWKADNPEKYRQYGVKHRAIPENREKAKLAGAKWREANREKARQCTRAHKRRKVAGFTPEMVDQCMTEQGGACAICRTPFTSVPHADHDHESGLPRALLCAPCNHGLGRFFDDPVRLRAAADYIEYHRSAERRDVVEAIIGRMV